MVGVSLVRSFWKRMARWMRGSSQKTPPMKAVATDALTLHSTEFKREILSVVPGVYVAVGFGLANSILLEGEDGVVVVDTLGSVEAATEAIAAFRAITNKPVKAIVYTHNHTDHIYGAGIFAGNDQPDIYAHATTSALIDKIVSVVRPIITRRSFRQFGVFLPPESQINAGIGLALETHPESTLALRRPTHTFTDECVVNIAGIELVMVHAPGETDDQIFVWLPRHRVMIAADNFYKSFPNLYAIRGTAHRDVMQWVHSLDRMREYEPDVLIPCHTRPVYGKDQIASALRDYRDAIQFVHDQTVRWMNRGLMPDAIVERVKLPTHLAESPYLQEFYGTVAWSVRSIFHGYLGWFDGNPTNLSPLSLQERAERIIQLAGGLENCRQQLQQAAEQNDHKWVLELTDYLRCLLPEDEAILNHRRRSLQILGEQQTSANGRNYFLTCALELQGLQIPLHRNTPTDMLHSMPLATIFSAMATNLNPEKCIDMDRCIGFQFPDTQEAFTLHIRRGVAEVQSRFPKHADISVTIDAWLWKEIVAGLRNPVAAFATGKIQIEGGAARLAQLLLLFEKPN